MNKKGKTTSKIISCAILTIAIVMSSVLTEPVWAAQAGQATPKLYTANKELGAYLDKALLEHRSEIVFHTKDRSMLSLALPTSNYETKLEHCSIMLYGIKNNIKSISWETVMIPHVNVIAPANEGEEAKQSISYTFAYYRVTIKPKYRYSKAKDRKFYNTIKSVGRKAKKKKGVRNRAKYINNYITKKVKYSVRTPYHYTAYAAAMKGKASCQGYSDLFTLIGREAGLNVDTVCGYAWYKSKKNKAYHAWNIIKNGKKWVQTDVTFNDYGGRYRYFMSARKKFNKNHSLDNFYNNSKWKKAHPLK